ncbi:hypothetical protein JY96_20225 [Aquabacterium sp. NJ1]|uniref:hypothetical protein n=1 Tax=Aquabacterium sp. NJ1 TaxID=1538295 RepID=UPI00052BB276|nr:hypothetical protein [Aquabacterium sp. NJ1]KGM41600.1 hypothetical protein JY96_20225 [Aquabacterium sp. NJ1]
MSRLQTEWRRLYLPDTTVCPHTGGQTAPLVDEHARVRAMVLELARPADWEALSAVWRGVQLDLALPAPGIAVSGLDGYQLWFSLAEAVPAAQAFAFLEALRARYLPEVAANRVTLLPTVDACAPSKIPHASHVPAQQVNAEHWSAFVAPDLAPVFADTPWLDFPPSEHGQADLLSQLDCITTAAFQHAQSLLQPAPQAATTPGTPGAQASNGAPLPPALDPKGFLLRVMNDEAAPLALRIEAAKALLPFSEDGAKA